jgi:hypothetical protein
MASIAECHEAILAAKHHSENEVGVCHGHRIARCGGNPRHVSIKRSLYQGVATRSLRVDDRLRGFETPKTSPAT